MVDKNIISNVGTVCDKCGKCVTGCPAQINITEILDGAVYDIETDGNPYDCIECGFCTSCCHMGIDVMEIIRSIAMEQCISCGVK
ncbi:MAG: 4Fe-4S dicluster domain-containing protein [Oscillospiraceae bacterium]|nr:4Fe-4S dicluster domain-containing protein [Oscillospiraceae bacterium]